MPINGGFKIACFSASIESACCISDQYLAQCFDPACEECIVDANSSTGYGGAFPKSCEQNGLCVGCQSGGNICPGECKCQPGVGCGCYTPGTYNPIACTGGGTCTETNCQCCNGGSGGNLINRTNTYTVYNVGFTQSGPSLFLTSFNYSYNYASCNQSVISVTLLLVKRDTIGHETNQDTITLPLSSVSGGLWTGSIFIPDGHEVFGDLVVCTGTACCTTRVSILAA